MTAARTLYAARLADGSLHADPAQEAVLGSFDRIAEALAEAQPARRGLFRRRTAPEAPKGLYLWGGVGRGKSMLMDLFVEALEDVPSRRVHFHAFMQEIHAGMHAARKAGTEDALRPVVEKVAEGLRVLAFDEMQITDITDAMIVGRLFEKLFKRGTIIVTTSNRHPDDLYKDGLNRQVFLPFIEILKNKLDIHLLESPTDYRQERLMGREVYHSPLGDAARAAMDATWAELTGDHAGEPLVLQVTGRDVQIPRFHSGIARATFADLCAQPLGAADYLTLAEAVSTLMIDDIPVLGVHNANEAKRFVTLIDALYEAKTRLICSAEAMPEQLYPEGKGAFEFERTASRIAEMRSDDWLNAPPKAA